MTWVLPNYTTTIEYPVGSGTYPQSQWDEVDGFILQDGISGNGVSSGCAVTQRAAGANQSVDVASGTVVFGGVEVVVSSGNVAATAAHATLPRFDLVVASNAGVKSITAGTAATTPVFPAIPANSVGLAAVFRRPADDIIETAEIVDKRVTVDTPAAGAGWTTVSKAADQTKNSDTTLANDNTLSFAMGASTKYRIRGMVFFDSADTPDFKYGLSGPASPTVVLGVRQHGTGSAPSFLTPDVAYPGPISVVLTTNFDSVVRFEFVVHNGANAGTFAFQWAQNVSDAASTIVRAGSYLEYAVA